MTIRRCIKEPIPAIFEAWESMSAAVDSHLEGDQEKAAELFAKADSLRVFHWLNPAWTLDVRDKKHIKEYNPPGDTTPVPKEQRDGPNIPTAVKRIVLERDGFRCRYCGIPVVDVAVRKIAHSLYPESVPWEGTHEVRRQHAGFAAMWLQYDHVVPRSHGGRNAENNLVITCALCNFAKHDNTLKQLNIEDPRYRAPRKKDSFDGLRRLKAAK